MAMRSRALEPPFLRRLEFGLIGISTSHELEAGEDEYSQIEPKAPVFDVPKVTIDPSLHQFETEQSLRESR